MNILIYNFCNYTQVDHILMWYVVDQCWLKWSTNLTLSMNLNGSKKTQCRMLCPKLNCMLFTFGVNPSIRFEVIGLFFVRVCVCVCVCVWMTHMVRIQLKGKDRMQSILLSDNCSEPAALKYGLSASLNTVLLSRAISSQ